MIKPGDAWYSWPGGDVDSDGAQWLEDQALWARSHSAVAR